MSLPWHARNHQDALDGMLLLTLEERGAYNTILDLIYQRSGPVPDDERWLAGWMGCSVKKWRLIRAALLVKGKLVACELAGNPALMDERAWPQINAPRRPGSAEWRRLRDETFERDGFRCTYCGTEEGPFEVDHIHPVIKGGPHDAENLTIACRTCNRSKGEKTVEEWMQ